MRPHFRFRRIEGAIHGCFLTLLCLVMRSAAADVVRPNIVLVVLDDFGWSDLPCYGNKVHHTPNIDQIAASGMRFTDAYAAAPVCSPTRAAIMTGKYPARLHLTDWLPGRADRAKQKLLRPSIRQSLPLEETTIAEVLQVAGYATASIGKWHLGGDGFEPERQGFSFSIAGDHAGTPLSYFAPYQREGRVMPGLETAPPGEYLTDRLITEAEKFIDTYAKQPFFLYLPHFAVHIPLRAKEDLIEKYRSAEAQGQKVNPVYAAMIESIDEGIGRLLRKLDSLQMTDNTVILLTSDNGGLCTLEGANTPATSNAPLRDGKGFLYEGGLRVPLIVKWPNHTKPASVSGTAVSSIDLFATIADICGVSSKPATDGKSLVPLLTQAGEFQRDALYWHYPHYSNQGGKPGGAIRAGDYKLIEHFEQGRLELFNVRKDPGEVANLAEKEPDRVHAMQTQLAQWRKETAAQAMTPNPDYTPNPQAADKSVLLHASTADVHGVMLRFEPQPHKNTLGFWTRADDWASWDFQVTTPGEFKVVVMQGCGNGSGGSLVSFSVGEQTLEMTVQETGGFQAFVEREIGTITLDAAGRYTLSVRPKTKPGAAVMDVRQIRLEWLR